MELQGPTSGINLTNPVDAGISLEDRPRTQADDQFVDSSSEFELSLDDSSGEMPQTPALTSSSDFDVAPSAPADDLGLVPLANEEISPSDSDNEFELSLESSDELATAPEPAPEAVPEAAESAEIELNLESSSDEVPAC